MPLRYRQTGFTLIDLMIVIVILGILAAIAIPNYISYVNRAKVSEGIVLAAPAQTAVSEWIMTQGNSDAKDGNLSSYNSLVGLPAPTSISGNNVTSVTVVAFGEIYVALSGIPGTNPTLVLHPIIASYDSGNNVVGSLGWECGYLSDGSHSIDPSYLPASCRNANPSS